MASDGAFDFGIPGYRPHWLTGPAAIRSEHGERLAALAGRRLSHTWVVWEHGDDAWFADGPVLLDFDGEQVEINHQKLEETSISWNGIDPHRAVRWPVPGLDLGWRADPPLGLDIVMGRVAVAVEVLERDAGDGTAIGFDFGDGRYLTLYDAGDENGLNFTVPGPGWRRHRLH